MEFIHVLCGGDDYDCGFFPVLHNDYGDDCRLRKLNVPVVPIPSADTDGLGFYEA